MNQAVLFISTKTQRSVRTLCNRSESTIQAYEALEVEDFRLGIISGLLTASGLEDLGNFDSE